jgi:hypothetical protein
MAFATSRGPMPVSAADGLARHVHSSSSTFGGGTFWLLRGFIVPIPVHVS